MQITARILRNWADEGGIPDLTLAELDYRLVHALHGIERPLAWLMEGLPLSAESRAMTQEDVKPYRPHPEA